MCSNHTGVDSLSFSGDRLDNIFFLIIFKLVFDAENIEFMGAVLEGKELHYGRNNAVYCYDFGGSTTEYDDNLDPFHPCSRN